MTALCELCIIAHESNRFHLVCSDTGDCSDEVQLITEDGSISVPIAAYVPQARVEMPVQLDFGFCAVNEVVLSTQTVCVSQQVDQSWIHTLSASCEYGCNV